MLKSDQNLTEGEALRSKLRSRAILYSASASLLHKVLTVLIGLVSVPLTINYLGSERYGIWLTITSLIALLAFADLGIGAGVTTEVSRANGKGGARAAHAIISSSYTMLSAIALIGCIFILFANWAGWLARVDFVRSDKLRDEISLTLLIFGLLFSINIPLGLIARIQAGMQEAYITSFWQCAGSIIGLASLFYAAQAKAGLPGLLVAVMVGPALCGVLNTATYFLYFRRDILPDSLKPSRPESVNLLKTGALFFSLQVAASLTFASDNLIINKALGPEYVTVYAVPEKLFALIALVTTTFTQPLWPAYSDALARGDTVWAHATLRKSIFICAGVAAIMGAALIVTAEDIIKIWSGADLGVSHGLLAALATWKIIESVGIAFATYLNGVRIIGLQVAVAFCTAIFSIVFKWYAVLKFGLDAIPLAMSLAYCLFCILPLLAARKFIRLRALDARKD